MIFLFHRRLPLPLFWFFNQRYWLPVLLIWILLSLAGCTGRNDAALEHSPQAMETGLMEVSVCAATDSGLLVPVMRRIASGSDYPLEALKLLVDSPENSMILAGYGLSAPLPSDTNFSASFQDAVLSVDVSRQASGSETWGDSLSMQAIQATAYSLPGVEEVSFSLNGKTVEGSVHKDAGKASEALIPFNPASLPVFAEMASLTSNTLYYPLGEGNLFAPVTAYFAQSVSTVQLIEALIKTQPPEGLLNPFPEDVYLLSAEETEDGLLLEFNDGILQWMGAEEKQFQLGLDSLWHTIREVQPLQRIILSVSGYPFKTYIGGEMNQIP